VLAPLPLTALAGIAMGLGFGEDIGLFFYGMGLIAFAGCGVLAYYDRRHDALAIRPREAEMLPEMDVAHGVLVRVRIIQGHALTGEDRGAMWTEEGRLMFCGRRTSFALARPAVAGATILHGSIRLALAQAGPVGPASVEIVPLFGDRPYAVEIRETLAVWLQEPETAEASQLPPLARGPNALTRRGLAVRASKEAIAATAIGLLLLLPVARGLGTFLPLLLAPLGLLVAIRHRRAWRDVKRLEERT
jgi:hypothetical protein